MNAASIITGMTDHHVFRGLSGFGLNLHFDTEGRGSGFPGAAWRGLLGQALFRAVCAYPAPACATCPNAAACVYPRLFKPLVDDALPPVWLHGWQRGRASWTLGLRWLGADNGFAVGEWLAALAIENVGLSFGGVPVRLVHATATGTARQAWDRDKGWLLQPAALLLSADAPPPAAIRVHFTTPLVSKHAGDPLYGALHTRLQRLVQQHGDGSDLPRLATPWQCRVLAQKDKRIPLSRRLLAGTEWDLELTRIDQAAWPLLLAGAELHAGGQTGMGCGQYEIVPAI